MADLSIATYEQIETILTKIATNYSQMILTFYDVFYNQTPMDVTFQMYNEAGVLQTYTIPNRAKDRTYILNGEGSPEGVMAGTLGSLYQDLTHGDIYIKKTPDGLDGWDMLVSSSDLSRYIIRGTGSPEGVVSGNIGLLYVNGSNAGLYIKTTSTGNTGWTLVSANTSNLAAKDLSNVTAAHFVVEKGATASATYSCWYRLYNDNWCEQGGTVNYTNTEQEIPFPKIYNSTPTVVTSANIGYANATKFSNAIRIRGSVTNSVLDWTAYGFIN